MAKLLEKHAFKDSLIYVRTLVVRVLQSASAPQGNIFITWRDPIILNYMHKQLH